jgi:hypothetical protein
MADAHRGLTIHTTLFADLLTQLARRGDGVRESGAFLLAADGSDSTAEGWTAVTSFALYDDLDPRSLTGGITFHAEGYTALAATCRRDHLRVVGDVHTHPHVWVGQSRTDATHPMSALPRHIALIVPRYATGDITIQDLGAHLHLGGGRWQSYHGEEVSTVFRVTGGRRGLRLLRWLRPRARSLHPRRNR